MPEYKIGDRVRLNDKWSESERGEEGVIIAHYEDAELFRVKYDSPLQNLITMDNTGLHLAVELDLVTQEKADV